MTYAAGNTRGSGEGKHDIRLTLSASPGVPVVHDPRAPWPPGQ